MLFGENIGVTGAILLIGSLCLFFGGHHYLRMMKAYRRNNGYSKLGMEYHSIVEPTALYTMAVVGFIFGALFVAGYFIERQENMTKHDHVQEHAGYSPQQK